MQVHVHPPDDKSRNGRRIRKRDRPCIVESFDRLKSNYTPAGLVNNHGPFTCGKDAYEAVHNAVVLEQIAKMAAISLQINPNAKMNEAFIILYS